MKKTLGIYYIATSNYKAGFEHFKKNLLYFEPDFEKEVIILSDGLSEWDNVVENNIKFKVHYLHHHPWPIISLFKMKYILDFWGDYDYVCYFNGNLQYNSFYSGPSFDWDKLNVSRHTFSNEDDQFDGTKFEQVSRDSLAYISTPYKYIHGGLFFGNQEIIKKMCTDVTSMAESDLKKNIIPQWHDESYLNRWCIDNPGLVAPKKKLIYYQGFNSDFPFSIIETIKKDRHCGKISL